MTKPLSGRHGPFRILMTADAVGGVWNYALELCRALEAYQAEVLLALMGPSPSSGQKAEAASIPNVTLAEGPFKLEWMDDCWDDVSRAGDWLLALEHSWNPEIVHLNGYAHGALPFHVPKLIVAHSCVLSWWSAVYREPAPLTWDSYAARVQEGLETASLVVAPSSAMLEALHVHYKFTTPTQVIPNGMAPCDHPTAKSNFIACVGRFRDRAKNLTMLEDLADRIDWPIVVIGDMPFQEGYRTLNKAHLIRTGQLESNEVRGYLASAAIFLSTALYEPFGLSILEAARSGCALVLSDIPSLRENWNGAAVFVDPRDAEQVAGTLNLMTQEPSVRTEFARLAWRRSLTFGSARCASGYSEVYRRLVAESSTRLQFSCG